MSTTPSPLKQAPRRLRRRIDLRQYGILAALAVIVILFQVLTNGRLLLPGNINNLIQQNAYVLILAVGMVIVIIAGHIDLSVGSVVAMVGAAGLDGATFLAGGAGTACTATTTGDFFLAFTAGLATA